MCVYLRNKQNRTEGRRFAENRKIGLHASANSKKVVEKEHIASMFYLEINEEGKDKKNNVVYVCCSFVLLLSIT